MKLFIGILGLVVLVVVFTCGLIIGRTVAEQDQPGEPVIQPIELGMAPGASFTDGLDMILTKLDSMATAEHPKVWLKGRPTKSLTETWQTVRRIEPLIEALHPVGPEKRTPWLDDPRRNRRMF